MLFPISRLPAVGRVFQSVESGAMSFNQSYPWQWSAMIGAGGYVGIQDEEDTDAPNADPPTVAGTVTPRTASMAGNSLGTLRD